MAVRPVQGRMGVRSAPRRVPLQCDGDQFASWPREPRPPGESMVERVRRIAVEQGLLPHQVEEVVAAAAAEEAAAAADPLFGVFGGPPLVSPSTGGGGPLGQFGPSDYPEDYPEGSPERTAPQGVPRPVADPLGPFTAQGIREAVFDLVRGLTLDAIEDLWPELVAGEAGAAEVLNQVFRTWPAGGALGLPELEGIDPTDTAPVEGFPHGVVQQVWGGYSDLAELVDDTFWGSALEDATEIVTSGEWAPSGWQEAPELPPELNEEMGIVEERLAVDLQEMRDTSQSLTELVESLSDADPRRIAVERAAEAAEDPRAVELADLEREQELRERYGHGRWDEPPEEVHPAVTLQQPRIEDSILPQPIPEPELPTHTGHPIPDPGVPIHTGHPVPEVPPFEEGIPIIEQNDPIRNLILQMGGSSQQGVPLPSADRAMLTHAASGEPPRLGRAHPERPASAPYEPLPELSPEQMERNREGVRKAREALGEPSVGGQQSMEAAFAPAIEQRGQSLSLSTTDEMVLMAVLAALTGGAAPGAAAGAAGIGRLIPLLLGGGAALGQ